MNSQFSIFNFPLTQPFYQPVYDIDMFCLRHLGKARHTQDFARNRHNHFGTKVDDNILDMEFKIVYRPINLRIGREGLLCLGNANRIMRNTHLLNEFEHFT